jgi:thymidylate synthase (FAD)
MTLSDDFSLTMVPRITVDLVDSMGNDLAVVKSARVSTVGADAENSEESAGLINFLMKGRHGTPFEHNSMTFRVTAPIFVWREHHRHRIGVSYNEESGRYKQLDPVFYYPAPERNLVQQGKPGAYEFVPGDVEQQSLVLQHLADNSWASYDRYQQMLDAGIAREVARMCLPVNIMSTCYVTFNARSLMHFLSLRTKDENSTFPSFPQREIEMVAEQYEKIFADLFPITYRTFVDNGRVAP